VQPEIYLNKYLSTLISNPERVSVEDVALLKNSVQKYPYFQALHLLLAKASIGTAEESNTLATTALHTNGRLLHEFLYEPQKATGFRPASVAEEPAIAENIDVQHSAPESFVHEDLGHENTTHEIYGLVEVVADADSDEQETYDEIGEIDIHDYIGAGIPEVKVAGAPPVETIEDDFVLENIAATDFFAFQENFSPDAAPTGEEIPQPTAADYDPGRDTSEVTNYNDDTLPYTFLWWLAKTRKEHQSFQPYASPKSTNPGQLQHQYVEHIFHLQSPFNAEEILDTLPEVKGDPKDLEIIDQFIKNAPQIGAPRPEQIDNENKAKKSAEDHNDLVSETLAKIYIEQMLYHKAIETYEKLSLKFPEKSRYFADLIQSIEKKI
jgi:hypothetical protein